MEEYIEYRGNKYWSKEIDMGPGRGVVTVSSVELNMKLMEDMESPDVEISTKATTLDEYIYYYLADDGYEQELSEKEMVKYIKGTE